jgi:SAM-dependent methyltransferase
VTVTWTEARVRALLAENAFDYQNVELPYGLRTGGKDRSRTAQQIFPADMAGKSLLDVGCMYGFFGFEAEKRGATRVVGADVDPENVRKCRLLAECLGSKGEFVHFDIERDEIRDRFDTVLCLNVLHHLRNPLGALEKLIAATRENLVLEVASFAPRDRRKNRVPRLLGRILDRLPILYLGGAGGASGSQTFFITRSAVETLLLRHRTDFARVDVMPEGTKGRFIAIGRRRRIGHLFVVAGVPAAGKTTLIGDLAGGRAPELAAQLGFDAGRPWRVCRYGDLREVGEPEIPNMLLHYNITRHMIEGDLDLWDRGLRDLIEVAERVSIATVWCPAAELARRYAAGRLDGSKRFLLGRDRRKRKKIRKMVELYQSPPRLRAAFEDWFRFAERHAGPPRIVGHDRGWRLFTPEEWERDAATA